MIKLLTHFGAHMVSIIQMGSDGSSMAIPILAKVMAPKTCNILRVIKSNANLTKTRTSFTGCHDDVGIHQ